MISLYHICPSKVRAYNSKGELKILFFYVCIPLVCSLTCRYMCFFLLLLFFFWGGGGGAGIRGGGAGIIRGGGVGIRGGGAGIR